MPGKQEGQVRQKAAAGRDANIAGRDLVIVNVGGAGAEEPAVPGLLPRDMPGFTGRQDELDRLTGLAEGGAAVVTAIGGTAGVGKTALAVHAAHRLLPEFPDGHLYADLRGYTAGQSPAEPGEVLEVFLRRLDVPSEQMPASAEERSGLLRQLLASRRVLMVLDNAATEAQVRPLLPGAGGSLVLITSRSMLPGLEVHERIGLDVLPGDEATALLAAVIGPDRAAAEPEAVAQVRDWCGRLPLALRIAGQLLAVHPAWPVARLVEMLASERDRLRQLSAGDLQVQAAFAVSYRQLGDGEARMFRLLGLHPGPGFSVAAAASLVGIDPEAAGLMLDRLVLAHLVTEGAAGRFGMHDLLRLFARGTCQEVDDQATRDVAEAGLVRYYAKMAAYLDFSIFPHTPAAQAAKLSDQPLLAPRQAVDMFEVERVSFLAVIGLAEQRSWDEQVSQLARDIIQTLILLRYVDDMLVVERAALAAARHAGAPVAEGQALNDLGVVYAELEQFDEAVTCYQESLTIRQRVSDRRGEGQTLFNLGTTYIDLDQFDNAVTAFKNALARFREIGHKDGDVMALDKLGVVYARLGQFDEAITYYEESLTISREIGDRHGEGRALINLGNAYRRLQRFEEAVGCYRQSLAIKREIGDQHGESQALTNLGSANVDLRRFEEAIGCYRQSLAIKREIGDRHGEGRTLENIGDVYQELRQPDRAAGCWRDAAAALRDSGDREGAERLEQLAINAQPQRRHWRRRANRSPET